ncbi:zinc ABC transporter ATP-binding protein ZnuC [Marivivens niveibacter]|uniref:Zinc ABC transporter ATP-binding protein ZnuC n=1 Tax=Marivivens niveibacter TaxID=1930667 RepID=A0A251WYG7_9RHOB|nr:metal ABC transporter ATP-binding protein [Marivivens niveibacter]OUD09104.1 zinc ABC transporter ATP-binding protein ZnuC [Marivivens niveibacter]
MSLITARKLSVRQGDKTVLQNVDFEIRKGEIVTIVGPNGSGKSTLLRTLIGAVTPESGELNRKTKLRIGYVPQKLFVDGAMPLTVRRFLDVPKRVKNSEAEAALDRTGVAHLADHPLNGLSGGQFQRVLLARAILVKPDILMLDEATQGLDQPGSAAFYQLIEELRDTLGCAVLMVSHELHVVMSASDRVICLNGHVCCEGAPDVVSAAPEYRQLFGTGTKGALALYRHDHNHDHDHVHEHDHTCDHEGAH